MSKKPNKQKYTHLLVGIVIGLFFGIIFSNLQDQPTPKQTLNHINKDNLINAVADKLNYSKSDVVIGVPYFETSDWVSVNAGNKNFGSGMTFIFKKVNNNLELIFNGQECPSPQLVSEKEIPEIVLSSNCK